MASSRSSAGSKVAAIISRPARPEVARTVPELLAWLQAHSYQVIVDPETAKYSGGQEEVLRSEMSSRSLNLVIVLGGDGTLLSAVRATAEADAPLLGVNLGSLGFLTDVPLSSLFSMLDQIAQGRSPAEQRTLMQCDLLRGEEILGSYKAFNDVVVNKTALARLNNYDLPTVNRLQIFNDSWFHITRRGGYFGLHNHPNASWSGVYCVDPGKSDPGKEASGLLSFVSPMLSTGMYQDAANAKMQLPYGNMLAQLSLLPGQLVMFPSWVLHDVKPFEGEGERITIAFNCWFTLPDP